MKVVLVLCLCLLFVYTVKCDDIETSESCEGPRNWSVFNMASELMELTKCSAERAFRKVSCIAGMMKKTLANKGNYLIQYATTQMLKLFTGKISHDFLQTGILGQLPEEVQGNLTKYMSFISSAYSETLKYVKKQYAKSKLSSLGLGDILEFLHRAGDKYGVDVGDLGKDISEAARNLMSNNITLNPATIIDEMIRQTPDSAISVLKETYDLNSTRSIEPKTEHEKHNRKTLDLLSLTCCSLLHACDFEEVCRVVASVIDEADIDLDHTEEAIQGRSYEGTSTIVSNLFQNVKEFPLHLFLSTRIKTKAASPIDFLALSLQMNPVYKSNNCTFQGRSFQTSSVPAVVNIKLDLLHFAKSSLSFLGFIYQGVINLISRSISVLANGVNWERSNIPTSRSLGPKVKYLKGHSSYSSHSSRKTLSFSEFDKTDVMLQCLYSEILTNKPRLSEIIQEKMDTVSLESPLSIEAILTKYLNTLQRNGTKGDFVKWLIPPLLKHVESEDENVPMADIAIFYFSCLEEGIGPLEAAGLSNTLHIGHVKDVIVETFDFLDHELSDLVFLSGSLVPDSVEAFIGQRLDESIDILLHVWGIYQNTRKNSLCFVTKLCNSVHKEKEYNWREMATRIFGIAFELLRCYEDGSWDSLPYMTDVLLSGEPACRHLPYEDCGENQRMNDLIMAVVDYITETQQ